MIHRRTLILGAFALATPFLASLAHADQLADIKKKGQIVFGVLGAAEPNSFIDPASRQLVGYEIDLATAVAKKLGVEPVFRQLAVAARIPELQQGRVDILAASLTHNRERTAQIDFALTHFITGSRVSVRKNSGIAALPQLAGKKVIVVRGSAQEASLKKAVPSAKVVTFKTTRQAFHALRQGKGVAFVTEESSLLADKSKLGAAASNFTMLLPAIGVEPVAMGLRKGETTLKKTVDQALRELEASGVADDLFVKWYGPDTRANIAKRSFKIMSDKI